MPTHGTDHHGELRGSTLEREEDRFSFLLVAFRSWYKYKRESVHGSASCRTSWLEGNNIVDGTSATRVPRCTDHSPYCETARGVQDFQLTVRLRKPCHRRCFSSYLVVRAISVNPNESVYCIAVEKKEERKKESAITILEKYFIRPLQLFYNRFFYFVYLLSRIRHVSPV